MLCASYIAVCVCVVIFACCMTGLCMLRAGLVRGTEHLKEQTHAILQMLCAFKEACSLPVHAEVLLNTTDVRGCCLCTCRMRCPTLKLWCVTHWCWNVGVVNLHVTWFFFADFFVQAAYVMQVLSIYLFHELPPEIRRKAAKEMARVLKPGGMLILTDSNQLGDRLPMDSTMGAFQEFNEPWYGTFIAEDFGAMFKEVGLECDEKLIGSSTKVLSFRKPFGKAA